MTDQTIEGQDDAVHVLSPDAQPQASEATQPPADGAAEPEAQETALTGPAVIIKPTIGRVVWYHPAAANNLGMVDQDLETAQPLSAQIAYVHDDYTVNLGGLDQYGYPFAAANVNLLTGNETAPFARPFACWMPYQLGAK